MLRSRFPELNDSNFKFVLMNAGYRLFDQALMFVSDMSLRVVRPVKRMLRATNSVGTEVRWAVVDC